MTQLYIFARTFVDANDVRTNTPNPGTGIFLLSVGREGMLSMASEGETKKIERIKIEIVKTRGTENRKKIIEKKAKRSLIDMMIVIDIGLKSACDGLESSVSVTHLHLRTS